MSGAYFDAVRNGLSGVLRLLLQLALPVSIFLGLLVAAAVVAYGIKGSSLGIDWAGVRRGAIQAFSAMLVGLTVVCLWSGLKQVQPIARNDIAWKDSAEASENPAPEAPPIDQYGPVAATMVEKTYKKSLALPPELVQRIGAEGVGLLSPYLVDPTADNVLKLVDSFKRIGQDVVFTREVTREDEAPMSFDSSDVKVNVHRLQDQAYNVEFSATYTFTNSTSAPIKGRFLFPPPQGGGTIQELKVSVGSQEITEPDQHEMYAWTGQLNPGEQCKASVHYKAVGARNWSYDLGSNRRRVKSFNLTAVVDGPVQFMKGGIQPTSRSGGTITWKLTDVVTSQRLALRFPPDVKERQSYLQALAILPATVVLFGLGVLLFGIRLKSPVQPASLAFALLVFGFGLGSTVVLANYMGPLAAVFIGPLFGALISTGILGWRYLLATIPVALLPATSLSSQNTGLWVLILGMVALVAFAYGPRWAGVKTGGV